MLGPIDRRLEPVCGRNRCDGRVVACLVARGATDAVGQALPFAVSTCAQASPAT